MSEEKIDRETIIASCAEQILQATSNHMNGNINQRLTVELATGIAYQNREAINKILQDQIPHDVPHEVVEVEAPREVYVDE